MDYSKVPGKLILIIHNYRVYLFVFFITLFIGLSLAHPSVLLNDEFITTNQLRQLHAGHQVIINEGKYGLIQNGSMGSYFRYKNNVLAYTLFLPLLSLPAHWMVDLTGDQFSYLMLLLWTVTALVLLLFINHFFRNFSYIGRWQWTPFMVAMVFLVFFINLYYYSPFSVDPVDNYPEILAIVFTNIILLALSAMLIYEINRTVFEDPAFSFFGTMVCLFSSSYFLWSTFCKDHILVLACFIPIVLSLVRFIKTDEYWYLPLAFLFSGLMAWARPEVAFWVFFITCGVCGYTLLRFRNQEKIGYTPIAVLCSPFFTIIGALPFFLNNLLITKNPFLPVFSYYLHDAGSTTQGFNISQSMMPSTGINSLQSILLTQLLGIPSSPQEAVKDLVGIFFYPQTGNISIFSLTPLFLVMIIFAVILLLYKKIRFTTDERKFISLFFLISLVVFLAYANALHVMNTDPGITPDIRYLLPIYFPFVMIGLIVSKKINILPENPTDSIKRLILIFSLGLVISLILFPVAFAPRSIDTRIDFSILGNFFSLYTLAISLLTIITILYCIIMKQKTSIAEYLIFLLCSLPFFWQVIATFYFRTFSGYSGYIFWIPAMRIIWELLRLILFRNVII